MRILRHVFWLGVKELRSLWRDPTLLGFVLFAFTVYVATAGGGLSLDVRNASVGVVDHDRSATSRRIERALQPPQFQPPVEIDASRVAADLDEGRCTFVLAIPPKFEDDLLGGGGAGIQLNVDATAVSQAFLGASYIDRIVSREVAAALPPVGGEAAAPPEARVRVRFNPNLEGSWHVSLVELLFVVTLLSMVLPAAALLREREHGTVEQLLAMPLRPLELMLGKVWANGLVVLLGTLLSLAFILRGLFDVPVRGSLGLFLAGTLLYEFATAGLGMFLATVARTVPQVALLAILVASPMMFLSGVWTPIEAMPTVMAWATYLSPLRYYGDFALGVVFRGAGAEVLWPPLAALAVMGAGLFTFGALRFRARFAAGGS